MPTIAAIHQELRIARAARLNCARVAHPSARRECIATARLCLARARRLNQLRADTKVRGNVTLSGRAQYEASVAANPFYHDGAPRPTWDQLSDVIRWSWERTSGAPAGWAFADTSVGA